MIMMTFPALFLAVFGYSAIREYKDKKAMNDEIQLHDGPQSEAQTAMRPLIFLLPTIWCQAISIWMRMRS